ncbi:MAG: hypothetical protein KC636_26915 [Myxococcales bacterium]|nr:hypothetical protein [Myxococcales bacterium]
MRARLSRVLARGPEGRARASAWLRRNAYLALAAGALLLLSRTVTFEPPELVRVVDTSRDPITLVGEAPPAGFDEAPRGAQVVQVRAVVRRYLEPALLADGPDLEADERGELISEPVVTTILGVDARVDQTLRLPGGDHVVHLELTVTPRLAVSAGAGEDEPEGPLLLDHAVRVTARRTRGWPAREERRVHLDTRGTLADVDGRGHRIVFTVDEQLFSLDLELRRG